MRKPILALLLGLCCFSGHTAAQAISLDLIPASQSVVQGHAVAVTLVISGLGDLVAPSLSAFDVDLTFNPAILAFQGAVFGDPVLGDQLDLAGLGGNPMSASLTLPGLLNLFEISFDLSDDLNALQADTFTLATLTFTALTQGSSALTLAVNALGDANGDPLAATVGAAGSITVTAPSPTGVPEPASALLVLTGALGLFGYGAVRRRRG